jgi:SAM-dependent methyltransferase
MESIRKTIGQLSPDEIRKLVRDKYSEVALHPTSKYKFAVGSQYALDLGYPAEEVHSLPETVAESFTGVSSFLTHFDEFASGSVILELGSGGGLDTALLAKRLDPAARIVGIDISMAMLQRAALPLSELDASHIHFNQGLAESLPIRDDSVDWVVSNGIFNLSPEKEKILLEIHRVLKPKGRVLCSEIVLYQDPSPEERQNEDDWFK